MIERNNEVDYDLICDICGYTVSGFDAFYEAVDYKKENGWKSQKHNGQREDIYPECLGGGSNQHNY